MTTRTTNWAARFPEDSGWQFFAGDESEEYCDEPAKFAAYDVNTVCNYDPSIIPMLEVPAPAAFARDPATGQFVPCAE